MRGACMCLRKKNHLYSAYALCVVCFQTTFCSSMSMSTANLPMLKYLSESTTMFTKYKVLLDQQAQILDQIAGKKANSLMYEKISGPCQGSISDLFIQ